jgi:hypothetical protein
MQSEQQNGRLHARQWQFFVKFVSSSEVTLKTILFGFLALNKVSFECVKEVPQK